MFSKRSAVEKAKSKLELPCIYNCYEVPDLYSYVEAEANREGLENAGKRVGLGGDGVNRDGLKLNIARY